MFGFFLLSALLVAWTAAVRAPYYSAESQSQEAPASPFYPSAQGYQFSSFRGPVSGAIKEIAVPYVKPQGTLGSPINYRASTGHQSTSVDYVAKPDYAFTFGVQDPETGNAQLRKESRDGDTVQGEYSVMEPDGTLRTVVYTADPVNGFQAKVKYGPSGLPPPPPPTPSPVTYTGVKQERSPHRFKVNKRPVYKSHEEYDEDF